MCGLIYKIISNNKHFLGAHADTSHNFYFVIIMQTVVHLHLFALLFALASDWKVTTQRFVNRTELGMPVFHHVFWLLVATSHPLLMASSIQSITATDP